MNWARHLATLLVLANWFACIVHCQAEQVLATESGTASSRLICHATTQGADGEECPGICDWVVTGGYKASDNRVESPDAFSSQILALFGAPEKLEPADLGQSELADWSTPPPERTNSFIYFCRTALPPRAPSPLA